MSRQVLPLFESVAEENLRAAEALSEPFTRDWGTFAMSTAEELLIPDADSLVAIGVSYVVAAPDYEVGEDVKLEDYYDADAVQVEDFFFLNPNGPDPFRSYRAFIDGYKGTVHGLHKHGDRIARVINRRFPGEDVGIEKFLDDAIDQSMRAGLRTLGSFGIFLVGGTFKRHTSGLMIPEGTAQLSYGYRAMAIEAGLGAGGEFDHEMEAMMAEVATPDISAAQLREQKMRIISGHSSIRAAGSFAAALGMPRAEEVEVAFRDHPLVKDFVGLSRDELRILEKTRRKEERKQQKES